MGMIMSKSHHRQLVFILLSGTSLVTIIFAYIFLLGKVRLKQKSIRSKLERMPIIGLVNYGNSCYLNSVLQALAASTRYREWILQYHLYYNLSGLIGSESKVTTVYGFQFPVVAIFNQAFQVINRDTIMPDEISQCKIPLDALRIIKYKGKYKFKNSTEEDAHEFYQAVMKVVSDETSLIKKLKLYGGLGSIYQTNDGINEAAGDGSKSSSTGSSDLTDSSPPILLPEGLSISLYSGGSGDCNKETDENNEKDNKSNTRAAASAAPKLIVKTRIGEFRTKQYHHEFSPFTGILSTQLQCVVCLGKSKVKLDTFDHITLNLPPFPKPRVTLSDLIDSYFQSILVHSVDCSKCSTKFGSPTKSTFSQKFAISRLPSAFCFHIQRMTWTSYGLLKRNDSVQFPDILNLSSISRMHELFEAPVEVVEENREVILNRLQNSIYSLRAVICHLGDSNSGHFITYRRASMPYEGISHEEGWFYTSDKIVRPANLSEVINSSPYMLFYEKPSK